jgi:hypothetical protein
MSWIHLERAKMFALKGVKIIPAIMGSAVKREKRKEEDDSNGYIYKKRCVTVANFNWLLNFDFGAVLNKVQCPGMCCICSNHSLSVLY